MSTKPDKGSSNPGRLGWSSPLPAISPKYDNSPQVCVLITEESKSLLCMGQIGSQSRFCLTPRDAGYLHCGIKAHGLKNSGTSKFSLKVDCYYLGSSPGILSHGRPMARTDPSIPKDRVPKHMMGLFKEGVFSSWNWSHMIINALAYVSAEGKDEEGKNYLSSDAKDDCYDALFTEDNMDLDEDSDLKIDFDWLVDISNLGAETDWGPTAQAHCAALDLLQKALSLSHKQHKSDTRHLSQEIWVKLGKLDNLIFKHGSLAGALEATLKSGTASYNKILKNWATLDNLGEELKHFAKGAEVTKEFLLGLITRVSELAQRGTKKALNKVQQVKELLRDATANQPPLPPRTQRLSTMTSSVNADTPIGTVSIGGNATLLTANMLFTMV
jgi:hypothetical protein